jgi:hypothetical protein
VVPAAEAEIKIAMRARDGVESRSPPTPLMLVTTRGGAQPVAGQERSRAGLVLGREIVGNRKKAPSQFSTLSEHRRQRTQTNSDIAPTHPLRSPDDVGQRPSREFTGDAKELVSHLSGIASKFLAHLEKTLLDRNLVEVCPRC